MFRGIDTSLDDRRFYLVNSLRTERQTLRDLLGSVGCNQLIVFAHRDHHQKLVPLARLYHFSRNSLADASKKQTQLLAVRTKSPATLEQSKSLVREAFV